MLFHRLNDLLLIFHIHLRAGHYDVYMWAQNLGVLERSAGLYTVGFILVTLSQAAWGIASDWWWTLVSTVVVSAPAARDDDDKDEHQHEKQPAWPMLWCANQDHGKEQTHAGHPMGQEMRLPMRTQDSHRRSSRNKYCYGS